MQVTEVVMLLPIVFRLRGGDDDTRTKRERLSLQKEEGTIETTVIISERRVVEANDYELKERKDHFYHFPLWTQFFCNSQFFHSSSCSNSTRIDEAFNFLSHLLRLLSSTRFWSPFFISVRLLHFHGRSFQKLLQQESNYEWKSARCEHTHCTHSRLKNMKTRTIIRRGSLPLNLRAKRRVTPFPENSCKAVLNRT